MKLIKTQTQSGQIIHINLKAITAVYENDNVFIFLNDGSHCSVTYEEWQKILKEITGEE